MRRRRSNAMEGAFIGLAVLVGGVVLLAKALYSPGGFAFLIICALILGGVMWSKRKQKQARIAQLHAKYSDPQIVMRILSGSYWQGQTVEQLLDSLGPAHSVDDNLLVTRKREVWKYQPSGVNRYRLRITLDDDVVVSWIQRN